MQTRCSAGSFTPLLEHCSVKLAWLCLLRSFSVLSTKPQTVLVRIWLWDKSLFDLAFVKFLYHITPLATWTVWAMKVEDAQPKFTYIIINSKALKTRAYFWKWAHLVPTKLNKTNLGTFSGHLLCCFPRTVQIFSRGYNTASWTKAVLFAYADIPFYRYAMFNRG